MSNTAQHVPNVLEVLKQSSVEYAWQREFVELTGERENTVKYDKG